MMTQIEIVHVHVGICYEIFLLCTIIHQHDTYRTPYPIGLLLADKNVHITIIFKPKNIYGPSHFEWVDLTSAYFLYFRDNVFFIYV